MDDVTDRLEPPFFLVAMPQVLDPFFNRSVVLMLEHQEDGSLGIIVNRPIELTLERLFTELASPWGGDAETLALFGGPVQPQVGTALFVPDGPIASADSISVVAGGVMLCHDVDVITRLGADPPENFRLTLGYAGWSPGQLETEMNRNDWLIAPFDPKIVFAEDPAESWTLALASIGVRPESLPSWTRGEDDEGSTN
ncbi:MAG: YqgE/AlgH family protein [Thermoanaerobaculia bacterium]